MLILRAGAEVVTLTATEGQTEGTGGVVVVTYTEDETSTASGGSQVIVVKVSDAQCHPALAVVDRSCLSGQTITSSLAYTRPATRTSGAVGQLQTGATGGATSLMVYSGLNLAALPIFAVVVAILGGGVFVL